MKEWYYLFSVTAGCAATLTGLLFVGLSINLSKILSLPNLAYRSLLALIFLLLIIIVSILFLIPNQPTNMIGFEILFFVIIGGCIDFKLDKEIFKTAGTTFKKYYKYYFTTRIATLLCYFTGSLFLISDGLNGTYWVAAAIIFSFVKAGADVWILLVQVNKEN